MCVDLATGRSVLMQLTKIDPDPRGRHRAHMLLIVLAHSTLAAAPRRNGHNSREVL